MNRVPKLVLVTPVKNEEALIRFTLESVVAQTHLPVEWVVVDDGSTDRTAAIVSEFAALHPWIQLLSLPPRTERNFAAVVHATETGLKAVRNKDYEFVGLIDADLRFDSDYFAKVLQAFGDSPKLGLAGGVVMDPGDIHNRYPRNREDVPGASQIFRRSCYEAVGRFVAIPEGGWDALTCAKARMVGYETRLLIDLLVDHLKPRNVAHGGPLQRRWQLGVRDYALGYHWAFEALKCASRMLESPPLLGSAAWWLGFCSANFRGKQRLLPDDLLAFLRKEQMSKLKRMFRLA